MFVRLNGFNMHYEDHGTGIPLLFLHGFLLSGAMWEPQVAALSDIARVLTPDLRGHGASDAPPGAYSMDLLAEDCHSLLNALGIQPPVVLCGLSMGGYTSFAYYRRYPHEVAAMILTATRASDDSPEAKAKRDEAIRIAEQVGPSAVVDIWLSKMMSPKTYANNPALVERWREIMERTPVTGIVGALMGMRDRPDSRPLLNQIKVPTLIIHGADDQLIPIQEAEAMHKGIVGSQMEVLPDAGHMPNLEQAELFNRLVCDFLKALKK
jgi:3-oxoadipate enol-lactonase